MMQVVHITSGFETTLENGTCVLFRRVVAEDKPRLQEVLARSSRETRYRRFFRDIDRFSESELRRLTELDFRDHFAWIATLPDLEGEPAIGVGRWVRFGHATDIAETAIAVLDSYQGRGIGKTLFLLLVRSALDNDINTFKAWVLGNNGPVFALLQRLEDRVARRWDGGGVAEVTITLPPHLAEFERILVPLALQPVEA